MFYFPLLKVLVSVNYHHHCHNIGESSRCSDVCSSLLVKITPKGGLCVTELNTTTVLCFKTCLLKESSLLPCFHVLLSQQCCEQRVLVAYVAGPLAIAGDRFC